MCKFIYIIIYIFLYVHVSYIYILQPWEGQRHVHEAQAAGEFLPGHGQCAVATIPEKDLRLLRTRSDLTETPAPPTQEVPPTQVEETQEILEPPVGTTGREMVGSGEETGEAPKKTPLVPVPPTPSTRSTPPSPAPSLASRGSSKYDKYKDGSYWKILAYILQMFVETVWLYFQVSSSYIHIC